MLTNWCHNCKPLHDDVASHLKSLWSDLNMYQQGHMGFAAWLDDDEWWDDIFGDLDYGRD